MLIVALAAHDHANQRACHQKAAENPSRTPLRDGTIPTPRGGTGTAVQCSSSWRYPYRPPRRPPTAAPAAPLVKLLYLDSVFASRTSARITPAAAPTPAPISAHFPVGCRLPPCIPALISMRSTADLVKVQTCAPAPSSMTTTVSRRMP